MTPFTMSNDCEFRFPDHSDPSQDPLDFQDLTADLSMINISLYEKILNLGQKTRVRNMFKK